MTLFIFFSLILSLATVVLIGWPLLRTSAPADGGSAQRGLRLTGVAVLGLAPAAAALIYANIGSPAALDPQTRTVQTDPSVAMASMDPAERNAMIEGMVGGLAARLSVDANDLAGWRMLARSYGVLGRHAEAADAWREALVLSEGAVEDWRGLAMSLIETNDAGAALAVREAFEEVLLQEPNDALALYFLGHAAMSDGDTERAIELWTKLRGQTPDDSPVAAELDALLKEAAGE